MKKPTAVSKAGFQPFDVVVVPFPYADRLAEKRRPAVVVSSERLYADHRICWLAMITSASNPAWTSDVAISDLASTALPAPSVVRPAKLATVDVGRIVRRIGKLSAADAARVKGALQAFSAA